MDNWLTTTCGEEKILAFIVCFMQEQVSVQLSDCRVRYLKLGCVFSGVMVSSQIRSRAGIQLVARWQFCSTTQVPSLMALSII